MIDTIFFDNWNTLVQAPELMSRGSSTKVFHKYLDEQGINIPYDFLVDVYVPIARVQEQKCREDGFREPDYRQRLEDVFSKLGIEDAYYHSVGAWKYYLELWPVQTEYFQGVPEMLNDLKQKYKLGLITNYMDGNTCRDVFKKLGYNEIFNSLVVSHELGYMKPAKILFEKAMKETDSNPKNCVMVGDTYDADVVGGNIAGMKTVLIDLYDNQHAFYHNCSLVIKHIHEFPYALKKLEFD